MAQLRRESVGKTRWTVEKVVEPIPEPNFREVYIELLQQAIEKLKESETYNLSGDEEIDYKIYDLPTIIFCHFEQNPQNDYGILQLVCYRDRREFVRELKNEDRKYRSQDLRRNQPEN